MSLARKTSGSVSASLAKKRPGSTSRHSLSGYSLLGPI